MTGYHQGLVSEECKLSDIRECSLVVEYCSVCNEVLSSSHRTAVCVCVCVCVRACGNVYDESTGGNME